MPPRATSHKLLQRRLRRTMNYGDMRMDNLTMPLSEMVVNYFDKHNPYDTLTVGYASKLAKECCVDPTTLIVALVYCERLRRANQKYFIETCPEDVYLAALVIATKYLHDGGLEEYIYSDEWGLSANRTKKRVNELELEVLSNLEWNLQIPEHEFKTAIESVERWIALYSIKKNNFFTYNDLSILVKNWDVYWSQIKVFCTYTGAISATYLGALYFAVLLTGFVQNEQLSEVDALNASGSSVQCFPMFTAEANNDEVPDHAEAGTSADASVFFAQLMENDFENETKTSYCSSDHVFGDGLKELLLSYRIYKAPADRQILGKPYNTGFQGVECF